MMDLRFLLFPVSGALIGCVVGWIFSRMLTGVVLNRKKAEISEQLASFVSSEIVSPDLILEKIAKPEHFLRLMPVIEAHIDEFLRNRLKTAIPMIGMLIGERTISQLKTVFMQELEVIFPEVLNKYVKDLGESFDFKAELRQRLFAIPPASIEAALYPVARKFFCLVGIVSGLLTGLINLAIFFL
jgi:uncharacterized membrane protein YheB (UPF0754 family)